MSKEMEVNRRDFLKATAQASVGLAALGGIGMVELPRRAAADPLPAQSAAGPQRGPKANWPQEYTVRKNEENGQLVLSTPYYSVYHDLKKGGAITQISYVHGSAPNLLLEPIASSIELAAKKLPHHITKREPPQSPGTFSDLHDSSPSVAVTKAGKFQTVTIEATLRLPEGHDVGVRTKTTYHYRWGYIKIHKEFIFPNERVNTAALTVFSTLFHPSLTNYAHRPGAFDNASMDPFSIEALQWGQLRAGSYLDAGFSTRFIPCHMVLVNPGIEGIEWFVADDLGQWYYQLAHTPGTGSVTLDASTQPPGVNLRVSALALPTDPDLDRGGFLPLAGTYSFDYYLGLTVLDGRAHARWLERSFGPNRGQWVSDEEIRRNGESGIITMTLHNDGDEDGDGLFWRDGTYPPYPPDQMKKMEHVIDTCHQNGIKVLPYFSNHELHQSTEAFKKHGEEWGRKPDDQGNLRPDYYYGSHMCFKSGWKDYFKSYVDTVLKHQPWDGIYYDWNMAMYCNNPLHMGKPSNGVSGAKGLAAYAYSGTGHWDVDEFLEMIEWTRERVGPDGLVTLHNTGVAMLAAENFADYVCGMEWGGGNLVDGMPKPDQLPPEWNFTGARSRADIEYGTIDAKAPPRVHRLFHLTALMTGTAPWPASYEAADLFKILRALGDVEQYHFEDWRNRAVKLDQNNLLSAVYCRPGEAYVLLANLQPESREVRCVIDPQALKHPMTSVRSAKLVDQGSSSGLDASRLTGEGEKITLPGDGVSLLHLQS
jgi:hypothetical protein